MLLRMCHPSELEGYERLYLSIKIVRVYSLSIKLNYILI
jgi:hypothetical protein